MKHGSLNAWLFYQEALMEFFFVVICYLCIYTNMLSPKRNYIRASGENAVAKIASKATLSRQTRSFHMMRAPHFCRVTPINDEPSFLSASGGF